MLRHEAQALDQRAIDQRALPSGRRPVTGTESVDIGPQPRAIVPNVAAYNKRKREPWSLKQWVERDHR